MADDLIINALKQRWFSLAPSENYPHTPDVSKEMDNLEIAIRELQQSGGVKRKT